MRQWPTPSLRLSWKEVVLHSAAGILFSLLLWSTGLLAGLESDTFDLRANLLAKPSATTSSVVIVRLDQESLDHIAEITGLTWPWPRELYAAVINNCKRRGALAIGFDVTFTEDSWAGVSDDRHLREAIQKAGNFALGSVFPTHERQGGKISWPADIPRPKIRFQVSDDSQDRIPAYPRATFPIADIVGTTTILSNIQHQPDHDGIYRRLHPFVMFDGEPLPSLGIGMYLAANPDAETHVYQDAIVIDGRNIPIGKEGTALLNFRGPSQTFPYLRASSLIFQEMKIQAGEIDSVGITRDLQNKYVLFGFTARALYDTKTSPTGKISGPEINATMLDNLLSGDFIRRIPLPLMVLSLFALSFLSSLFIAVLPTFRTHVLAAIMFMMLPGIIAVAVYRAGYHYTFVPVQIAVATSTAISIFRAYFFVHDQEKFIRHSFKHYLSPTVIDELISNPDRLKLGGERKELTMFFSDLEGFTRISEWLDPEDLTQLLNEFLTAMTDIILEEEGTVDKFEGDAIIAFWNAPLDIENHAEKAVKAALRCQERLDELRPYFLEQYGIRLYMRIGLNTGHAVAGNMGSSSRFDYTVLGDAVNLAARLEGANKQFGTYTMISSSTFEQLGPAYHCREIARLRVVGRNEPVTVYEPLSFDKAPGVDSAFDDGRELFYRGDLAGALQSFSSVNKRDQVARAYRRKCSELLNKDIEGWTGVWELYSK